MVLKLEIHFVQYIIKDYNTHLTNSGKTIILCWIPSHFNILGNERADTAAKSALSLPITWSSQQVNFFLRSPSSALTNGKIYGTVVRVINFILFTPQLQGSVEHSKNISRYDSVLINRLHIGHSRLTHTYCVVIIHLLVNRVDFCFCETHLGRMFRLAGHSYKIFYGLFCWGAISKYRQFYHY